MRLRIFIAGGILVSTAFGAVTSVQVLERSDVLNGVAFGAAGAYERVIGKVRFAVDPKLAANRIITDIDLAPRNEAGLVEFSADLYVLKPRDPAKGNGTALLEISNRGGKSMLGMFNFAGGSRDPRNQNDFGDRFLLEQGYTLVWIGWQFDVPLQPGMLRLEAPIARHGDEPITGVVRSDWVVDVKRQTAPLSDRNHIAYPVLNPDDPAIHLTVRGRPDGMRSLIPRTQWKFSDSTHVFLEAGFEPGKIYEVVYTAKDPAVVGLGPAAVRDFMSFLKYGGPETPLSDQSRYLKRTIGFGISQSGRFLRTFVYYGFNVDEKERRVLDGVWAHVAGGGRGSFNHRFAQPSRDAHPLLNFFYPTDIFPFTDLDENDPLTDVTDGLLARARKSGVVPKIFYTNGSYEYWGRAASLIHTTPDGERDAPIAPDTRIYFLAGTQHQTNLPARKRDTQYVVNPADYRVTMRALLIALQQWLKDGKEPPASQYPRIEGRRLVSMGDMAFPKIPEVEFPTRMLHAWHIDYGPQFRSAGIITNEPPIVGQPFPTLVPQVNRDGNEISGIRSAEQQVPLATYTGWNRRDPKIGAPDSLANLYGSMFPFARTKAEREKSGDPRLSIEERYKDRDDYLSKVEAAARRLVTDGFLLADDVSRVKEQAAARWDSLMK